MYKKFTNLPRLIQIVLLLIPGVNWVVEVIVRWSAFKYKKSFLTLVCALFVTITGYFIGWLDALCCLFFKHLIFA